MRQDPSNPDPLPASMLTAKQLANRLNLSRSWIYDQSNKTADPLPGRKPCGIWLYDPAEVMAYLNRFHNQEQTPPASRPRGAKRVLRHLKAKNRPSKRKNGGSTPDHPEDAGQ